MIIAFDRSYALNLSTAIHKQVNRLADFVKPDDEVNILSATTMMAVAIQASGIGTFWRSLANSVKQEMRGSDNESEKDPSTDQSA